MLIVEGCDNTGKTTLVLRLADDVKLLHIANKRKPKKAGEFFSFLSCAINLSKQFPTIFDRWTPISEQVYGPIVRGGMIFSKHDLEIANMAPLVARIKPLLIYCRPKDETIFDFGERGQMEGVHANAKEILAAYDNVIGGYLSSYHVVSYSFERPGAYDVLRQRVLEHIKENYVG